MQAILQRKMERDSILFPFYHRSIAPFAGSYFHFSTCLELSKQLTLLKKDDRLSID